MTQQDKPNYAMMGFLAITIGVVGLVGVFATYALPIPYERLLIAHHELAQGDAAKFVADAHALANRLRLLIVVVTVVAAVFGVALMGAGRRVPPTTREPTP